uniref:Coenzyme PQQ synthesis protein F n=1 Tax=Kluyvera intermedia TaxID=61648 RepID=Q7X5R9_KLUIN|nr:PqqF [Kluyvera intermedia]
MHARQLTLANGLRCHLYHQPDAREAAALMRVQAGSLDEADRWPGLAHLLEHLLFCGSEAFHGDDRLMPWLQQQGGQVNATTQLSRSAYFFQLPAAALSAGVLRLCNMLASPLLTAQAIQQETAVIEAEYQLLQNHADTLSEAAVLDKWQGRFQRFRVGSRQAFGDNVTELQSALRDFHSRLYCAENMELWLQGPQSLDELEQLAARFGGSLLAGGECAAAVEATLLRGDRLLLSGGEENFWLTMLVAGDEQTVRDNVTLLKAFWQDEAPYSLLAQLRVEALCETFDAHWLWQDEQQALLALRFSARCISPAQAQQIEQRVWQHLAALAECTALQLRHYAQLAQQDFATLTLSPLEQLRGRALGFAPGCALPDNFTDFAAALPDCPRTRLLTQQQIDGAPHAHAGLHLAAGRVAAAVVGCDQTRSVSLLSCFSRCSAPSSPTRCAAVAADCTGKTGRNAAAASGVLSHLEEEDAQSRQRQLRPLLAELRHAGGNGSWQQTHASWQLLLNLPASADRALFSVHQALQALNTPMLAQPAANTPSIVIRQLLAALPTRLIKPLPAPQWLAAWCGTNTALSQRVAHLLSDFTPDLARDTPPARLQHGIVPIACDGRDQALLLFMPLPQADDASLAALRVLALMLETRFFQRLRVDQQIGYVVSARYQRVADVDGLMLALQSPDISWRALLGHCKRFMR